MKEKPPLVIPWTAVGIIAGGVLIALTIVIIALRMHTLTPDQVATRWLTAVCDRNLNEAHKYTTSDFESSGFDQTMSERKSDEYYKLLYDYNATYKVSPPQMDVPNDRKTAVVAATFTGNGQTFVNHIHMKFQGKQWKIVLVDGS